MTMKMKAELKKSVAYKKMHVYMLFINIESVNSVNVVIINKLIINTCDHRFSSHAKYSEN